MILATIKSKETLSKPADGFILGTPWGLRCDVFSMDQIPAFSTLTTKPLYLNMERIIHQADLVSLKEDLMTYHSYVDGIYFSDMSFIPLAKELGILPKLIYNPSTLVTNASDVEVLLSMGLASVCLAKELTLEELVLIANKHREVEIFIHGYLVMFYSKRQVLSNFTTKESLSEMHQATLTDDMRMAEYPVIEDEHGSHILQQHPLASFHEFSHLQAFRCRIDGFHVSEFEHHFVLQCYDDLAQGQPLSSVMAKLEKTLPDRTFTSGFYYKKTTYTQSE